MLDPYSTFREFYSHVNYSVTKIMWCGHVASLSFYSHVNYSVTKINLLSGFAVDMFYSHVNYSVTKMWHLLNNR